MAGIPLCSADGKTMAVAPAPNVENLVIPPAGPVPTPGAPPITKGSDIDKGKCPSKVKYKNKKICVKEADFKRSMPPHPAGTPPSLKGIVSLSDRGKCSVITVIPLAGIKIRMQGKTPDAVGSPLFMNKGPTGNVPGTIAKGGASKLTSGGPGGSGGNGNKPKGKRKGRPPRSPEEDKAYQKLRKKSPSSKQKKENAKKNKGKKCPACGQKYKLGDSKLAPSLDHVVSLDTLVRIKRTAKRFVDLPYEEQLKMANDESNYETMCRGCNSSKREKLMYTWKGNKRRNIPAGQFESYKKSLMKRTSKIMVDMIKKVKNFP